MRRVALATYAALPDLSEDDHLLIEPLQRLGVTGEPAVWDNRGTQWQDFDAVVIRSCWDYHLRPEEFAAWISMLEELGVPLWNPPGVVRWNMDKVYLRDLESRGARTVPTVWLGRGEAADLAGIMEDHSWNRAVVKPTISASAYGTTLVTLENIEEGQRHLDGLLGSSGAMVQKLVEEVATAGEWSFVFMGGEYSHAVLKRPGAGDFRVQSEFGGSLADKVPDPSLVRQAQEIVMLIEGPLLYTRVDAVEIEGKLTLMELELIEPHLFLGRHAEAAERFARAIAGDQ